jgi:branched-chain amino acid transport system substrate-binding protein
MKRMSIFGVIFSAVPLVLGFLVADGCADPYKIGMIYSGTGSGAHTGIYAMRGVELAIGEINAQGGIDGNKVEVVYENDDTSTEKSVTSAKKLVYGDKVLAIIGPEMSPCIFAVQKVTEEAKIPVLSPTGSSPKLTEQKQEWYFRNSISARYQTVDLVEYIKEHGIKRLALLVDWGRTSDQVKTFEGDAKKAGLAIAVMEKFQTGDTSFMSQLLKIKGENPDGLVLFAMPTEGSAAAIQARDLGINVPLFGIIALSYKEYIEMGGKAVEGTVVPSTFVPENPDPQVVKFNAQFKAKYNVLPDHSAAHAFDAANILAAVLKEVQIENKPETLAADRKKIRDGLTTIKNYRGVAAIISYGPTPTAKDRDGMKHAMLVQVKGGKWVIIQR